MSHRVPRLTRAAIVLALAGAATAAQAVTEIQWWHAQTGGNNERIRTTWFDRANSEALKKALDGLLADLK